MTPSVVNFVHVNGRTLYIVDWRMVVVGGENVLHHVQRGELSGMGKCSGNMSRGKMFKEDTHRYHSVMTFLIEHYNRCVFD